MPYWPSMQRIINGINSIPKPIVPKMGTGMTRISLMMRMIPLKMERTKRTNTKREKERKHSDPLCTHTFI